MSDGREVCGEAGRRLGRGAGRGTAEDSAAGDRNGSSVGRGVVGAGVGLLAGSVSSVRFGLGVASSDSIFFLGVGDLSGSGVGLFLDFDFDFGVGDLPRVGAGLGLFFLAGDFVDSGVSSAGDAFSSSSAAFSGEAFDLGVGDWSPSAGLFVALVVGSGFAVAFAFAFGVGVEVGVFFAFDVRLAGFGFALGEGVTDGVGEVTARTSSRAFWASRFFFSSSADCAWTSDPTIATSASAVPRKTRSRITAGERNRAEWVINSRRLSELRGLWHRVGGSSRGRPLPFASQNRIQFPAQKQKQTSEPHPGH